MMRECVQNPGIVWRLGRWMVWLRRMK